jgi:hypothetical protein
MPCPNCGSENVWDDNLHWGCNKCKWCSLAGLNSTRTPSAPYSYYPDATEVEKRKRDWADRDAQYHY